MAPEQARGRTVDKRADIWAFGVVVWEMLTGRPLFRGETLTDTLAAVLTREIDWSQLPGSTPPALVDLLRRCLERDPKKRLRDIGDVRLDDSALATASAVGPAPSTARRWWLWGLAMSAALAAGVAIGRIGPGAVAGPRRGKCGSRSRRTTRAPRRSRQTGRWRSWRRAARCVCATSSACRCES